MDDIDDRLDESERLAVKYFGNAKRYAVCALQNMGVMEMAEDADREGRRIRLTRERKRSGGCRLGISVSRLLAHLTPEAAAAGDPAIGPQTLIVNANPSSKTHPNSNFPTSTSPLPQHSNTNPTPHTRLKGTTNTHKLKKVRRITAISILEALAKVGQHIHTEDGLAPYFRLAQFKGLCFVLIFRLGFSIREDDKRQGMKKTHDRLFE